MRCYKCKEDKPESEFYKNRRTHRGFDDYCKLCRRAVCKVNYHRSPEVKEQYKERSRQWIQNNKERVRERDREYYRSGYSKAWKVSHNHKRRAMLACVPSEPVNIFELFKRDNGVCRICLKPVDQKSMSQDHIVPITKGGHDTWANSQLAHLSCNIQKGDKLMEELNNPIFKGFRGAE